MYAKSDQYRTYVYFRFPANVSFTETKYDSKCIILQDKYIQRTCKRMVIIYQINQSAFTT